jgi:hypothetical protein
VIELNPKTEEQETSIVHNGKGGIRFVKRTRKAIIKSPLHDFEQIEQTIEYRKDPLTDHWSRVNALRAERVKQAAAPGAG